MIISYCEHDRDPYLCELHDGGQNTLDAIHHVDRVWVRDDVLPHIRTLVLQLRQEEWLQPADDQYCYSERTPYNFVDPEP